MIEIDTSQIANYATVMAAKPKLLQSALKKGLDGLLGYGVQTARGFAPHKSGSLAAAIKVLQPVSVGAVITGSYGVRKTEDMPYPFMREYGGTIVPKKGQFLKFPGRNGGWIFVRSVTQTGTRYMNRSFDIVRPRLYTVAAAAVARVLGS